MHEPSASFAGAVLAAVCVVVTGACGSAAPEQTGTRTPPVADPEAQIAHLLSRVREAATAGDQTELSWLMDGTGGFALAWVALKHAREHSATLDEIVELQGALRMGFILSAIFGAEIEPFIAVPVGEVGAQLLRTAGVAEDGAAYFGAGFRPSSVEGSGERPVVLVGNVATIEYATLAEVMRRHSANRMRELAEAHLERCEDPVILDSVAATDRAFVRFVAPSTTARAWHQEVRRIWSVKVDCPGATGFFVITEYAVPPRTLPTAFQMLGFQFFRPDASPADAIAPAAHDTSAAGP